MLLVVPLKSLPNSRPKWPKCIPVFRPKRPKNPTLLGWHIPIWLMYIVYEGVTYRSYSISFNLSYVGKFFAVESLGLYQSSGKKVVVLCLVFPSLTKCEIRHFHVVVVQ